MKIAFWFRETPTRETRTKTTFFGLCVALAAFASPALAQSTDVGKRLYDESCAGCHGATGAGGDELAELLTVATPDLTTLSARHDGKFPMLDVIHIIDGRTGVRAHGGAMPVFGKLYAASSAAAADDYGTVLEVHGRVLSLALYLESIQK